MQETINDFLAKGWIEECTSAWASNAFAVPKKGTGKYRLVIDYRFLNEATVPDAHPMPLIEEMVQKQAGNRIFTVIDMKKGFHQMYLHPDDRPQTAMNIGGKRYQWKVMPMGIKNGPTIFQKMMDSCLGHLPCCSVYVDDIIIGSTGSTEREILETHAQDVQLVLEALRESGLVAEVSKTAFFTKRV